MRLRKLITVKLTNAEARNTIDHAPVKASEDSAAKRERALAVAQHRYGRPFKCGGDSVSHEVLKLLPGPVGKAPTFTTQVRGSIRCPIVSRLRSKV